MRSLNQNFLEAAEFLGAKLCREAIWDDKRCNWFGCSVVELRAGVRLVTYRMCGIDYYSGTAGIAVFLSHLYAATEQKLFRLTAEAGIRQALSRLDDIPLKQRLSVRVGLIGIAQALLEIAKTSHIEKFNSFAMLLLEETCRDGLDHEVAAFDLRTISILLRIDRDQPTDFLKQTAVTFGERLMTSPAAGPSHYNLPVVLLDLYRATGEDRFKFAAETELENAIVLDDTGGQHEIENCLNKLHILEALGDKYFVEAKSPLEVLSQRVFKQGEDFSISSGLAGQADILIEAARLLREPDYRSAAERIGLFGIDHYRTHDLPWPCGEASDIETSGLMNGLAGIGYLYLRLSDELKTPSLLF